MTQPLAESLLQSIHSVLDTIPDYLTDELTSAMMEPVRENLDVWIQQHLIVQALEREVISTAMVDDKNANFDELPEDVQSALSTIYEKRLGIERMISAFVVMNREHINMPSRYGNPIVMATNPLRKEYMQ
jgi:hypothetical protein